MIQNAEIAVSKLLPLLEKVKISPNKGVKNETLTELKIIKDYMVKVNGYGDDPCIRNLLGQMSHYIAVQLDRNVFTQSKELTKIIFNFITHVGEFEDVRILLREDFSLLKYLPLFFKMELSTEERVTLLGVIEILTRDFSIAWKAPYLVDLVRHTLSSIIQHPEDSLEISLQVLINLCSTNHSCTLILRGCEDYKLIWKVVKNKVGQTGATEYLITMVSHLNYLTEIYIPAKSFSSGYETAKGALAEAIRNHDKMDYFVKLTRAIRQMLDSICGKMKSILEDDNIKATCQVPDEPENFAAAKFFLLETVTGFQEDLHKFVNENRDRLQDDIKESILLSVTTFLLPYTVSSSEPSLLRNCMAAAETARRILTSSSKPKLQLQTYKTILRVSELIFQNNSIPKEKSQEFISLFKDVVRSLKIDSDTPLVGLNLDLCTINLRLFSLLVVDPQVKDSAKQKLSANTVMTLFNKTSGGNLDQRLKFRHSVFAVELLNVARYIFRPEECAHYLSIPTVLNHVSNCVRNGDEKEISRALMVISSVGQSNMQAISRSLRQSQEIILNVPSTPADLIPDTSHERMEVEMTSHYIDNHKGQDTSADSSSARATDLLAWCEIRKEVHQQEITMLNNHILQLNKTNCNLNALLEKQSHFVARHLAANEQRELEISTLQNRNEDEAKRAETRAKELEAELSSLRQEGIMLAEANESMGATIQSLKQNIEELNAVTKSLEEKNSDLNLDLKKAKEDNKSLTGKNLNTNQQLESAVSKISKLEDDVKLKENELEQLHNTLKQRQVQIDAIQSILGPMYAGKFDL